MTRFPPTREWQKDMSLVKKVQNTVFQHSLFQKGDKIILGVSGGPDSACMLDIFSKLREKYNLELLIAHVNYGLRGKDSEIDEKFVRELAEKYSLVHKVHKVHKVQKLSENSFREIRYKFFEELRRENKFNLIAVAHNADDQVETFLMRIIRGSGLQGLAAMQFRNGPASTRGDASSTRGGKIIRPLLATTRAEIYEYLKKNKFEYRLDKTNLETKFLRNKIRNKLIPYLEKNFNPNIKKTIFNAATSIAADYDLISDLEEKTFQKFPELKISKILKLHPALQKRVLRRAIEAVKADLKNIDVSHIEEILKIVKSTKNKAQVVVFKGLKITRRGDKLKVEKLK